jgi:carbonic anhydrase
MATSPTQRSLKHLRDQGYTVAIVEHWNGFVNKRFDLFGFIDLLALRGDETLAVQTTSYSNVSARVKKITNHENVAAVRDAGWSIHIHGWHKVGRFWQVREVDLS